ncbi:GTPase domain-containing protein [Nocardioides montaniterrae]
MSTEVVAVRALGVTVGIEVAAEHAPVVRAAWSRSLADAPVDTSVALGEWHPGTMSQLSSMVTIAAIDRRAGELWMLHAAGLADPDSGRTVALVGPSGVGKSTAVRQLTHRFAYVTDETVGVTLDGRVLPHPKPLSVIVDGAYPKVQTSPDDLGLLHAPDALTLAAVVVLRRDGTPGVTSESVRRAAALPLLAEHTSHLTAFERPLRTVADLLAGVPVLTVRYADAADLAPLVADLVGRS